MFVELPAEDWQENDEECCGLLQASLYGTRDAAQNWEEELGRFLVGIGFEKGRGSRLALEDRIKDKIKPMDAVVAWI